MKGKKLAVFVVIATIMMFSTAAMAWDNDHGCSLYLLQGKYTYSGQGFTLFSAPPPTGFPFLPVSDYVAFSLAGTVAFDGHGNLTSFDFSSLGGGAFARTGTGTYAVDTTKPGFCGFSGTWTFSAVATPPPFGLPPITLHFYAAPSPESSVLNMVITDPGVIFSSPLYKQ